MADQTTRLGFSVKALAVALLVAGLTFRIIKYRYFSPLSKYPGPFLASFSELWKVKTALTQKQHLIYYDLHKKYGPIMRDGPNSLSFWDARAIKTIYATGKNSFERGPSFGVPPGSGPDPEHPPIFFILNAAEHREAKKKVVPAYSLSSILSMEQRINDLVRLLLKRLDEQAASDEAFDLARWINFFTLDAISELAFGEAFGFLSSGEDVNGVMEALHGGFRFLTIMIYLPFISTILFKEWFQKLFFPQNKGFGFIHKMAFKIVDDHYAGRTGDKPDLVKGFMAGKDIHRGQVTGELISVLTAGGDTTALAIASAFGCLMQKPSLFEKLRREVGSVATGTLSDSDVVPYADISRLPYLSAVISETLRYSSPLGNIFYRCVPQGGAEVLPGHFIPGGTMVGINTWVMGRNKKSYGDDAKYFRPERWLEGENKTKFSEFDIGFGHGQRMCIGKNLALVGMYKAIFELVRRYDFESMDLGNMWREESRMFLYKTDMMVKIQRRQQPK